MHPVKLIPVKHMSVNGAETGCTVPGPVCDCCVCTAEVLLAETHIQLSATERSFMFSREKKLLLKSLIISFQYYCFLMSVHWCL